MTLHNVCTDMACAAASGYFTMTGRYGKGVLAAWTGPNPSSSFPVAPHTACCCRQVPVGRDMRVSAAAVARALTRNTVLVVASSPCFPHGVIDDVAGIAQVSSRLCLWVSRETSPCALLGM